MKYSMEYQESFVQKICENLWTADIHPDWQARKGGRFLEIFSRSYPLILCNLVFLLLISMDFMLRFIYVCVVIVDLKMLGLIIITFFSYDGETVEYWKWYQKIEAWMKRSGYQVSITEEVLDVNAYGKQAEWTWEQVKWYRVYSQVLLIYVGKMPRYVDLKIMKEEDRMKLRDLLRAHAPLNQKEKLTRQFHLSALKKLRKGIRYPSQLT